MIQYLIICPLVFLAGFIDSIAGGGGPISLPAYLLAGLPPHMAAGTNKLAASLGTTSAAIKYWRSGCIPWRIAAFAAAGALPGAIAGARFAIFLPGETLRILIIAVIPIFAVLSLFSGKQSNSARRDIRHPEAAALIIGLFIGAYDGLTGPGTGTLFILLFSRLLKAPLLEASGAAKIANLASNISALLVFVLHRNVLYQYALPAAFASIAGNILGAKYAIKFGSKFVRKMLYIVLSILLVKLLYDIIA